eukprot:3596433-Pleurochrysis_carterae.AAC.1
MTMPGPSRILGGVLTPPSAMLFRCCVNCLHGRSARARGCSTVGLSLTELMRAWLPRPSSSHS